LNPLPRWTQPPAGAAADSPALAMRAGIALYALDAVVRAQPAWLGHFRQAQALAATVACSRRLRLRAGEAELRDAVLLTKPGDDPGPAGRLYRSWLGLASRPARLDPATLARLAEGVGIAPIDLPVEQEERRAADPIAAAAAVAASVMHAGGLDAAVDLGAREILALMAADLALAEQLGWPVAAPLFATSLWDPRFRTGPGERRPRPDDANWQRDAYPLVADAAARAHARAIEIDRRAARLLAAVPRLHTKGAEAGAAALLAEESVAPWTLGKPAEAGSPARASDARARKTLGSHRAARRFCDRLVELGALRERTSRPTFRLYGL
jgi:hypothetical protein